MNQYFVTNRQGSLAIAAQREIAAHSELDVPSPGLVHATALLCLVLASWYSGVLRFCWGERVGSIMLGRLVQGSAEIADMSFQTVKACCLDGAACATAATGASEQENP